MDKAQGMQQFWSSFGIPAYHELTVPEDAELPYITYELQEDNLGNMLNLSASVYYRSTSWQEVTAKVKEIEDTLRSFVTVEVDDGYLWIMKGTPFAQRVADASDNTIRRMYLQIIAEYLTK